MTALEQYRTNPVHRNGTQGKSQWKITTPEELACFRATIEKQWVLGDIAWGLHAPAGTLEYLGVAEDHETLVFIAKFVGKQANWHGYPADHQRNFQDIPDGMILECWMNLKLLAAAKARKLLRGQPCCL